MSLCRTSYQGCKKQRDYLCSQFSLSLRRTSLEPLERRLHPLKFHGPEQPIDININSRVKPFNNNLNFRAHYFPLNYESEKNKIRLSKHLPGFSYKYECGSKANTFGRLLQGMNPLSKTQKQLMSNFTFYLHFR